MASSNLSPAEQTYVAAYRNVIDAVSDCRKFVTQSLADQIDALEAQIGDEARIEQLKDMAR